MRNFFAVEIANKRKRLCPRCKTPLKAIDLKGIEVDKCPDCGGTWFDAFELETFLHTKRSLEDFVPYVFRNWINIDIPCPVCSRLMQKLTANNVFPFGIEKCGENHGYWIDKDELDQISETVAKKTIRVLEPDTTTERKMEAAVAERKIETLARRPTNQCLPPASAEAVSSDASFFELSAPGKLIALLGLPVEYDIFYYWRSWANLCIIAANIVLFLLMVAGLHAETWIKTYGFIPALMASEPSKSSLTLLTSMFLHGGVFHLLGNMYFLFVTGDDIERRIGHIPYVLFYLAGGAVADIVSMVTQSASTIPHIGASGAISAVMGAYLVLCPHKSFYVWLMRVGIFGKMICVSAWMYMGLWFGFQILSTYVGNPGVDYWAHIGGFAFGIVLALIMRAGQRFDPETGDWIWRWKAG